MDNLTDSSDSFKTIMLLRDLLARTGGLHQIQVNQLQYYPLIVLPHATKASFGFDFEKKEIIFFIKETKGPAPKDLDKRLDLLVKFTKTLLGEEYRVRVLIKGKDQTSGKKNEKRPKQTRNIRKKRVAKKRRKAR